MHSHRSTCSLPRALVIEECALSVLCIPFSNCRFILHYLVVENKHETFLISDIKHLKKYTTFNYVTWSRVIKLRSETHYNQSGPNLTISGNLYMSLWFCHSLFIVYNFMLKNGSVVLDKEIRVTREVLAIQKQQFWSK